MKMKCSSLLKKNDFDEEKLRETISSHITLLQSTIQATRKLTSDLFPSILDDLGFIPAVRWYSDSVLKSNGLKVTLDIDKSVEGIPAEIKLSIFRIVQEAFQNIAKTRICHHCGGGFRVAWWNYYEVLYQRQWCRF